MESRAPAAAHNVEPSPPDGQGRPHSAPGTPRWPSPQTPRPAGRCPPAGTSGAYPAPAAAASSFTSSQCDYTDLQAPSYYGPFPGYPSGLYQYPYFHSPRRPYASPLLGGLSVPPAHSPPSNWEQPVYTTLTRP